MDYNKNNPHVKHGKDNDGFVYPIPFADSWEHCNNCISKENNNYKEHAKNNILSSIRFAKYLQAQPLEEIKQILIDFIDGQQNIIKKMSV